MHLRVVLIVLAAALVALVPLSSALAQQAPTPAPAVAPTGLVTRHLSRFDVGNAPEKFDLVGMIIDFAPGAWTRAHTHGGYIYITVVEGELSTRTAGMPASEKKYQPGGTFVESPGEFMELGNSGAAKARVIATAVLPKGAPLTINQQGVTSPNPPPGPTVVHRATAESDRPAAAFELVQFLLDFNPGAWTPVHTHGGQELLIVTAGEVTLRRRGRVDQNYKTGESWINPAGLVHAAGNPGAGFAQTAPIFLLPKGGTLTTVQPAEALAASAAPAQLPRTGGVGLPLLVLGGGALAGAAFAFRRKMSR